MLHSTEIEQALKSILPQDQHSDISLLAQILTDAANKDIDPQTAVERISTIPGVQKVITQLAGYTVSLSNALIGFGQNNQLGDIRIDELAGGNILKLSVEIAPHSSSSTPNLLLAALIIGGGIIFAAVITVLPALMSLPPGSGGTGSNNNTPAVTQTDSRFVATPTASHRETAMPSTSLSAAPSSTISQLPSPTQPITTTQNIISFEALKHGTDSQLVFEQNREGNLFMVSEDPSAVVIIADAGTDEWLGNNTAPRIVYRPAISADFEATVRIDFEPTRNVQAAGLGVRPVGSSDTFLRIKRELHENQQKIAVNENVNGEQSVFEGEYGMIQQPYSDATIYFLVRKIGSFVTFAYRGDEQEDWVILLNSYKYHEELEIYLFVLSTDIRYGAQAEFSYFQVKVL